MKKLLIIATVVVWAGLVWAQDTMKVTLVNPDALAWKDNPNVPKGAQVAVLLGDPTKTGEAIVQRVKLPAHYKVPPHTHPYAETITVLSGSVGFGTGEKFDATKGTLLKTGAFYAQPAKYLAFPLCCFDEISCLFPKRTT